MASDFHQIVVSRGCASITVVLARAESIMIEVPAAVGQKDAAVQGQELARGISSMVRRNISKSS